MPLHGLPRRLLTEQLEANVRELISQANRHPIIFCSLALKAYVDDLSETLAIDIDKQIFQTFEWVGAFG